MPYRFKTETMVQALTILSALQLFSEGAEGTGEPYGISRGVLEGAARASDTIRTQHSREFALDPGVPALSQITSTPSPPSLTTTQLTTSMFGSEAQKPEMPPCSGGRGVLRYERMPNVRRAPSSSDSDVVRLSEIPADVLFKCQNYCLKDETTASSRSQPCGSFDFISGKRISSYSSKFDYTESKCFLASPDELPGRPPKYENDPDYYHYREVCYSGPTSTSKSRAESDCPERLYVMERLMGKRFLPAGSTEVNAKTLEECQQICLNQAAEDPLMATSICRSGTFDHQRQRCYLSTYNRRSHPFELQDERAYDYFENTCIDVERRCPQNKLYWMKEENAELSGPYDHLAFANMTLKECQNKCLLNKNIFCRSLEYDEITKICIISDEDSVSRPQNIKRSASKQNIYMELTCLGANQIRGSGVPARPLIQDRQPLSDRNMKEVQTAFQLFRNSRLELNDGFRSRGREGNQVTLAECLDACLEEKTFRCRSVQYSELKQSCILSELNQVNGRLTYDADTHYFENLMTGGGVPVGGGSGSFGLGGGSFSSLGGTSDNRGFGISSGASRFGGASSVNSFGSQDSQFYSGSSSGNRFNSGSSFNDNRLGGSFGTASSTRDRTDRFGNRDRFSNAFDRFNENNIGFGTDSRRGSFGTNSNRGPALGTNRGGDGLLVTTGADRFAGSRNPGGISSGAAIGGLDRPSRFGTTGTRFGTSEQNRFGGGSSTFNTGNRFGSSSGTGSGGVLGGSGSFGASSGSFGASSGSFGSTSGSFGSSSGAFGNTGGGFGSSFGGGSNAFGTPGRFGPSTGVTAFSGGGATIGEVSQQCNPDGSMEFMLRTPEPFRGRIYTHGYYDRCFYRGGGSSVNMLKISPPRGFPDCGTSRYGDTTTNIVVVQFADGVMTSSDKRYNLTCTTVGPGDTVVTSEYIGSGLGAPIPIEYLPEKSRLDASVRLMILYSGRPTTTVAVGDPLTFRIESLAGRGLVSDIFATNVVARDPITGRAIELIDSRGCPVQTQVFPALGRARTGDGLEARFSAFKIPESNVMVFEAKVRMCRRECEPAVCTVGPGREEAYSFGKRRRRRNAPTEESQANSTGEIDEPHYADEPFTYDEDYEEDGDYPSEYPQSIPTEEEANMAQAAKKPDKAQDTRNKKDDFEEEASINEVIRVYMNEEEAHEYRDVEASPLVDSGVCIPPSEYYSLLSALIVTLLMLVVSLSVVAYYFRQHRRFSKKNATADAANPRTANRSIFPGSHPRTVNQPARYFPSCETKEKSSIDVETSPGARGNRFSDPSEPIYTDPKLFENSEKSRHGRI